VELVYDYGQLYVYDAAGFPDEGNPYLDALDAAVALGLTVGTAAGVVDVLMPRQENFGAAIDVVATDARPSLDDTADHVVEFDLRSSGRIVLEGSGGSGTSEVVVAPGRYRARLSGYDFDAAASWSYGDPGYPADRYRLELWPSDVSEPPAELRRWPGYDARLTA
jgi:hypothetical protein